MDFQPLPAFSTIISCYIYIYIKFRGAQAWAIKPTDCHAEATRLGHLDLAQRPL